MWNLVGRENHYCILIDKPYFTVFIIYCPAFTFKEALHLWHALRLKEVIVVCLIHQYYLRSDAQVFNLQVEMRLTFN